MESNLVPGDSDGIIRIVSILISILILLIDTIFSNTPIDSILHNNSS